MKIMTCENPLSAPFANLKAIEKKLDVIVHNHWSSAIGKLDAGYLAEGLRTDCEASFPEGYFSVNAWDILLRLYQADKLGTKLLGSQILKAAHNLQSVVDRYLDILMQDGFVFMEQDPTDKHQIYASLTDKGRSRMSALLSRFREKIATGLGVQDAEQYQE